MKWDCQTSMLIDFRLCGGSGLLASLNIAADALGRFQLWFARL